MATTTIPRKLTLSATKVVGLLISIALISTMIALTFVNQKTSALDGWNAGNIIADTVFTDSTSLSTPQIQAFMQSKNPVCDTWGTQPSEFGGGTRAQWGTARGTPPPYICLKDYSEYGKTSAQIIYDASQEFQISPKVLLVLLQKEQGLVTDTWPLPIQYRSATGYGCPDTAACDSQYYGLTNQIRWSARMFRAILNNSPTWYTPYVLGNNFIRYSPDSSCGGSNVNIQNRSTQGLYNYTPYQPNQGALNAGWGQAPCGAYGNRNFYLYFTNWFGSTSGIGYDARVHSQSPYPTILTGETKTVSIQYRNQGFARWYDDTSVPSGGRPVHLAATSPINRSSIFSATWLSPGRTNGNFTRVYESNGTTLASNQHAVEPGQIAVFEFQLSTNNNIAPGVYREHFQPVLEGASDWSMGGVAWIDVTVQSSYQASFHKQSAYPTLTANDKAASFIEYKNTGSSYWYDTLTAPTNNASPVRLAASGPINQASPYSSSWPAPNRASNAFTAVYNADGVTLSPFQHVVRPGEIARFEFDLTAKDNESAGTKRQYFQPVLEGVNNWNMGGVAWIDLTIAQKTGGASFYNQSSFPTVAAGSSAPVFLAYKNTSNSPWYDDVSVPTGVLPMHLATTAQINRYSAFSFSWSTNSRPVLTLSKVYEADGTTLASDQHTVRPSQIAQFNFNATPPWSIARTTHREYFQPIIEGSKNWNIGGVSWQDITVTN